MLLRGLGRLEVFPSGDSGLARTIEHTLGADAARAPDGRRSYRAMSGLVERWAPARGWAYFVLGWATHAKRAPANEATPGDEPTRADERTPGDEPGLAVAALSGC